MFCEKAVVIEKTQTKEIMMDNLLRKRKFILSSIDFKMIYGIEVR